MIFLFYLNFCYNYRFSVVDKNGDFNEKSSFFVDFNDIFCFFLRQQLKI